MGEAFPEFAFSSGEEASDPLVWHDGLEVRVDELAQSGHLDRLEDDLRDVAELGIRVWRYGMPWRLTEPEPGRYDWSLWDRALAACEASGLVPVVDLCHFGLPDHYAGFCHPDWVEGFIRYVDAFLARYRDPLWFTPVNEPNTVALTAGRIGVWNDRRSSEADFALALSYCALANVEAHARIRADRDGWSIGAEAIACPVGDGEPDERTAKQLALGRATWDLHLGHDLHELAAPAFDAVDDAVLARIAELATSEHVIAGHDFYPVSLAWVGGTVGELTIADRIDAYRRWALDWYKRYRVDCWVAETSNLGLPISQQVKWLDAIDDCVRGLRTSGLPVRGICWYSRGDQFDWHTMLIEPVGAVTEVGLFDQARTPRPVASRLRQLIGNPRGS